MENTNKQVEQTAKKSRKLAKKARKLLKTKYREEFITAIPILWDKINETINAGFKKVTIYDFSYPHEEFAKEYFDRLGYIISIKYNYLHISWEKPKPEPKPETLSLSQKIRKMWENITKDL